MKRFIFVFATLFAAAALHAAPITLRVDRCVRLSPIAQYSPLLPPVGVWTVSKFQCGRTPSQAG